MTQEATHTSPRVSVIMTAFNAEAYIKQAIESVMMQSFQDFELLIADDCSTDRTKAIINALAGIDNRIKTDHNTENMHYMRTRNKLLKQTKGAYITLLDADDLITKNRLERQVHTLDDHPEIALCGSQVSYIDAEGNPLDMDHPNPLSYDEIKSTYLTKNPFIGSSIMIRRNIFESFGWYRDFFNGIGCEDYDLTSRVLQQHPCINLPDKLYIYRQFEASTSRADITKNPLKFHSKDVVKFLAQERLKTGSDSLDRGDEAAIHAKVEEWQVPYRNDPSKVYIDQVEGLLYSKLYDAALNAAVQAIKANPWKLYNYRTYWYCLKQKWNA